MKYCPECGGRMVPNVQHEHDEAGLIAMKRNPFLALLMNSDGTMNPDAPVILGGGPAGRARSEESDNG